MAIEVTDEMRAAVYAADCTEQGHQVSVQEAIRPDPDAPVGSYRMDVRGPDGEIAHLRCTRCGQVWLVIEEPAVDYAGAVSRLRARVKNPDEVVPKTRRSRTTRTAEPDRGHGHGHG